MAITPPLKQTLYIFLQEKKKKTEVVSEDGKRGEKVCKVCNGRIFKLCITVVTEISLKKSKAQTKSGLKRILTNIFTLRIVATLDYRYARYEVQQIRLSFLITVKSVNFFCTYFF